jgi:hypothetical protein
LTRVLPARIGVAIEQLITRFIDPLGDELGKLIVERANKVRADYTKANRKLELKLAAQQSEAKQLRTELAIQKAMVRSLQAQSKARPKATTLHSVYVDRRGYRASLFFEDGHSVDNRPARNVRGILPGDLSMITCGASRSFSPSATGPRARSSHRIPVRGSNATASMICFPASNGAKPSP